jgi:hypothetical protein
VLITNLSNIFAIAAGGQHSHFLKSDSTVWACGVNSYGQLGDGSGMFQYTPVQLSSISAIKAVAGGEAHTVFLHNGGAVWTCGWNMQGQLGDGTNTDRPVPVQITSLGNVTSIATGMYHSVFIKNGGTAWTCGENQDGALGNGTNTSSNVPVEATGSCSTSSVADKSGYPGPVLYPNPSERFIRLESAQQLTSVEVFNITGQRVLNMQHPKHKTIDIDLGPVGRGVYFIRIYQGNNSTTRKVAIQ